MLKIVYPVCSGIDVHKTFVVATIASTDSRNITTYQTKRFSTFTKDLRSLAQWLSDNQCVDVCMESTGKYWIPVYNILEPFCRITLAHPKYVKAIRGKKTDKKDSIWIADLHKHGWSPAVSSHRQIFARSATCCASAPNWSPLRPARRTGCKTP